MYKALGIELTSRSGGGILRRPMPGLIAERPPDNTGMIAISRDHPDRAIDNRGAIPRMMCHLRPTGMTLHIGFIDDIKTQPGDAVGLGAAASLAITPEITGSLGLNVSFIDELELDGIKVDGSDQTVGFLDMSLGFLISRRLFLSLFAGVGITDDAPDLILGISTPLRY